MRRRQSVSSARQRVLGYDLLRTVPPRLGRATARDARQPAGDFHRQRRHLSRGRDAGADVRSSPPATRSESTARSPSPARSRSTTRCAWSTSAASRWAPRQTKRRAAMAAIIGFEQARVEEMCEQARRSERRARRYRESQRPDPDRRLGRRRWSRCVVRAGTRGRRQTRRRAQRIGRVAQRIDAPGRGALRHIGRTGGDRPAGVRRHQQRRRAALSLRRADPSLLDREHRVARPLARNRRRARGLRAGLHRRMRRESGARADDAPLARCRRGARHPHSGF